MATINTSSSNASPVSLKKRNPGSDIDDDLTIVASSGPIGGLGGATVATASPGGLSNHRPHRYVCRRRIRRRNTTF